MIKHVFHDVIVAYANGEQIQVQYESDSCWQDVALPNFDTAYNWRVKPEQTDLQKYGIEVGDVWSTRGGDSLVIRCANVGVGSYRTLAGTLRSKGELKTLLFRRGARNKL